MSNCVEIYTVSAIDAELVDIEGLKREEAIEKSTAWWYLAYYVEDGWFHITWGNGRSSHTWRDLRAYLKLLSQYIKGNFDFVVEVADEYDGFRSRGEVTLRVGENHGIYQ